MIRIFSIILFLLLPIFGNCSVDILDIIKESQGLKNNEKISFISAPFIGTKVILGPLGEGIYDVFDRDPLFNFNEFDCTTFVETVMALSLSQSFEDFQKNLIKIRYQNGVISFLKRNHFISLDWIPNNTQVGFLRDITYLLSPVSEASAIIDKKNWFQHLDIHQIQNRDELSLEEKLILLKDLRALGEGFKPSLATIPFIDIVSIFNNIQMLNSIPDGAIISIIRPNWDLTSTIGTHLNVSHQGLAIWKNGLLYYRHASLEFKKVMDIPLEDYLRKHLAPLASRGINIQEVLINRPNNFLNNDQSF